MQHSPKISRDNTEIQPSFITKINYNRISIVKEVKEIVSNYRKARTARITKIYSKNTQLRVEYYMHTL